MDRGRMRSRFRLAVLCGAAAALVVSVIAGCSSSTNHSGGSSTANSAGSAGASTSGGGSGRTLTLATDAEYPPCQSYKPGTQDMVGFEVDLWNAIAAQMRVTLKVSSIQFANLIPGVQGGKFDLAMECITDRAARESQVALVDFYYAQVGVIVPKDNPKHITSDPASLCGLTSGAQTGEDGATRIQTFSKWCTDHGKSPVTAKLFPQQAQVLLALKSGRVDFTTQDMAAASYIAEQSGVDVAAISNDLIPKVYNGIVVNKNKTQLQQELLQAIKAIIADGQYAQIFKKWNLPDALMLAEPGLNLATARPLPTAPN